MSAARVSTAVLISGRGSNMQALVEAAADPHFPASIDLVIANRPDAAGLAYAQAHGIRTALVEHRNFASREAFDAALQAQLSSHHVEFICLAGFMRVLTADFVAAWAGRIINIHPSLLPDFKGLDTHARALAAKVGEHGCSVHHVTAGLDEGEVIMQARVAVLADDTPATLAARVLREEHRIYPLALAKAVRALASGAPSASG
ncbi:MAG: phosphoribosylglycinamide formyltransferase [Hyphomicrobiales bacterium]|nr:phosphoribosylglycinamide formyltransferase [Hyphomicrobiales bacterium]